MSGEAVTSEAAPVYATPRILLIPSLEVFSVIDLASYYDRFIKGRGYTGVVLPLVETTGVYFDYRVTVDGSRQVVTGNAVRMLSTSSGTQKVEYIGLHQIIRRLTDLAGQTDPLSIYFSVHVDLPQFAHDSASSIADQSGFTSARACINKATTLQHLEALFRGAFGQETPASERVIDPVDVAGIVLYAGDLWPVSGAGGRFQLTCFCEECAEQLSRKNVGKDWFKKTPNPANLALAEMEDDREAVSGYLPVRDLEADLDPEDIIDRCAQVANTLAYNATRGKSDGKMQVSAQELMTLARQLKAYLTAKSTLSQEALKRVFREARKVADRELHAILLVEAEPYLWTTGIFFKDLVTMADSVDEVWLPVHPMSTPVGMPKTRAILASRACYFVYSFVINLNIHLPAFKATRMGTMPFEERQQMLRHGKDQVLSELPQKLVGLALPATMAAAKDAVVVGLDAEIIDRLIENALGAEETHSPQSPAE